MIRYEFSYGGDKFVRIRFRDMDSENGDHKDYVFTREEFQEFIDNAWYMLVETMPPGS